MLGIIGICRGEIEVIPTKEGRTTYVWNTITIGV